MVLTPQRLTQFTFFSCTFIYLVNITFLVPQQFLKQVVHNKIDPSPKISFLHKTFGSWMAASLVPGDPSSPCLLMLSQQSRGKVDEDRKDDLCFTILPSLSQKKQHWICWFLDFLSQQDPSFCSLLLSVTDCLSSLPEPELEPENSREGILLVKAI